MAGKILQVVNGQASKLVVDITFLLQGETEVCEITHRIHSFVLSA